MNIFDVIIVLLLLMAGVVGLKQGVIRELISFVGIVLVFFISYSFKGVIGNFLCKFLPFFTFTGNFKGLVTFNIVIYQLIGFIILFSILMILYRLILFISKIVQKIVDATIILTLPSAILGFIVGLLNGYLIILVALLALIIPMKDVDLYNESKVKDFMLYETPIISDNIKDISMTMSEIDKLVEKIDNKTISTNDANLQITDTMLKYKVIDAHTMKQVIALDKLDDVKGINKIVDKYDKGE